MPDCFTVSSKQHLINKMTIVIVQLFMLIDCIIYVLEVFTGKAAVKCLSAHCFGLCNITVSVHSHHVSIGCEQSSDNFLTLKRHERGRRGVTQFSDSKMIPEQRGSNFC